MHDLGLAAFEKNRNDFPLRGLDFLNQTDCLNAVSFSLIVRKSEYATAEITDFLRAAKEQMYAYAYIRSGAPMPNSARPFLIASFAANTSATFATFSSSLSVRMCSSW